MNDLNNLEHLPTAVSETPSTAKSDWFAKLIDRSAVEGSPKRIRSITLLNLANFLAGILTSAITTSSSIKSTSASGGVGYGTGAGGAGVQGTNATTAVTLNNVCGTIALHATQNVAAGAEQSFTLTNSTIAATDVVVVSRKSGTATGTPIFAVTATAAGSCVITMTNLHASTAETGANLVLNFAVIKAVAA